MNVKQLSREIAKSLNIPAWEATSRVEFNVSELELNPENITASGAAEIERCISADIRAGK